MPLTAKDTIYFVQTSTEHCLQGFYFTGFQEKNLPSKGKCFRRSPNSNPQTNSTEWCHRGLKEKAEGDRGPVTWACPEAAAVFRVLKDKMQ